MGRLTTICPLTWSDLLDFAGSRRLLRHGFIAMASRGQAAGFALDGEMLAIAFLVPVDGSLEFCLSIQPHARVHVRELVGIAHLTLARLAETVPAIHTHVVPGNRSGERMARLVGFAPMGEAGSTLWRYAGRAVWDKSSKASSVVGTTEQRRRPKKAAKPRRLPTIGSLPS